MIDGDGRGTKGIVTVQVPCRARETCKVQTTAMGSEIGTPRHESDNHGRNEDDETDSRNTKWRAICSGCIWPGMYRAKSYELLAHASGTTGCRP